MQYDVILRRKVVERAYTLTRSRRCSLEAWLDRISAFPFDSGDFEDLDATGRSHQVKRVDELLLTFWVDHAAREVRIVALDVLPDDDARTDNG